MRAGRTVRDAVPHRSCLWALCLLAWMGGICVAGEADDKEELTFSLESLGAVEEPEVTDDEEKPPRRSFLQKLTDNVRATIDLSARAVVTTEGDWSYAAFAGFDVYKVFSLPSGDWGTLIMQGYVTRLENARMRAPFFERPDDWEFVWRIFNFNYTGLEKQYINFRVGHFEIPFGLEQIVNTNGTLRQYIHGRNIGVKADWGVSVNGTLQRWEYEVSLTRGTGNEWTDSEDPHIFAGRLGTSSEENWWAGVSAMAGQVLNPGAVMLWRGGLVPPDTGAGASNVVRRWRAGVDGLLRFHDHFAVLGEICVGEDFDQGVVNALAEIHWQSPDERVLVYVQVRVFFQDFDNRGWDDMTNVAIGGLFSPDNHWAFSAQYNHDTSTFSGSGRNGRFALQVRYRF